MFFYYSKKCKSASLALQYAKIGSAVVQRENYHTAPLHRQLSVYPIRKQKKCGKPFSSAVSMLNSHHIQVTRSLSSHCSAVCCCKYYHGHKQPWNVGRLLWQYTLCVTWRNQVNGPVDKRFARTYVAKRAGFGCSSLPLADCLWTTKMAAFLEPLK